MERTKYDDMPLDRLKEGLARAEANGDEVAASQFRDVLRYHPENLLTGYGRARESADVDAQEQLRDVYYKKRPVESDEDLVNDPMWLKDAREYYEAEKGESWDGTDEELGAWALNKLGQFNYQDIELGLRAEDAMTGDWSPKQAQAFLGLMEQYSDRLPNFTLSGTGRFIKGALTSPSTYLGGGLLGLIGKGAATKGTVQALKQALKKKIKDEVSDELVQGAAEGLARQGVKAGAGKRIAGTAAGGAAGGAAWAGADDYVRQQVEQAAGALDQTDVLRTLTAAGGGAVMGATLAGVPTTVAAGLGTRRLNRAAGAIKDYEAQGDIPTTLAMQRNLIEQVGTDAQAKQARELQEAGDVEGLAKLHDEIVNSKDKATRRAARSPEANAAAAKRVSVEASERGQNYMRSLGGYRNTPDPSGRPQTMLPSEAHARISEGWRGARMTNPGDSIRAFDEALADPRVTDPRVRGEIAGLKTNAQMAQSAIPFRTQKAQRSRLSESLRSPVGQATADFLSPIPGGSTTLKFVDDIAISPLMKLLGRNQPTAMMRLTARNRANRKGLSPELQEAMRARDRDSVEPFLRERREFSRMKNHQDELIIDKARQAEAAAAARAQEADQKVALRAEQQRQRDFARAEKQRRDQEKARQAGFEQAERSAAAERKAQEDAMWRQRVQAQKAQEQLVQEQAKRQMALQQQEQGRKAQAMKAMQALQRQARRPEGQGLHEGSRGAFEHYTGATGDDLDKLIDEVIGEIKDPGEKRVFKQVGDQVKNNEPPRFPNQKDPVWYALQDRVREKTGHVPTDEKAPSSRTSSPGDTRLQNLESTARGNDEMAGLLKSSVDSTSLPDNVKTQLKMAIEEIRSVHAGPGQQKATYFLKEAALNRARERFSGYPEAMRILKNAEALLNYGTRRPKSSNE